MENEKGATMMIAFDFEYYQPLILKDADEKYRQARLLGEKAVYFNGGTEFITFARKGQVEADVIIDLKTIPDCHRLALNEDELVIGAAVTLNEITESDLFPLLGDVVKKIADHTSRNKITIGVNINSRLMYKEALLGLFVVDAEVEVIGENGRERQAISKLKLKEGEFISQIFIPYKNLQLPFVSLKRTKLSKVGYPVVSIAAVVKDDEIRVAFSGLTAQPFRCIKVEEILNDATLSIESRIEKAIDKISMPIIKDLNGSEDYRKFVTAQLLWEILQKLEVKK